MMSEQIRAVDLDEIFDVYCSARASVEGPGHILAARLALEWIGGAGDATEREFRYRCAMAASKFRTGVMDPSRFRALCADIHGGVNELVADRAEKRPRVKKAGGKKKTAD